MNPIGEIIMLHSGPISEEPVKSAELASAAVPAVSAPVPAAVSAVSAASAAAPAAAPAAASAVVPAADATITRDELCTLLNKYDNEILLKIQIQILPGDKYLKPGIVEILPEKVVVKLVFPSEYCTFGPEGIQELLNAHKNFVQAYDRIKLRVHRVDQEMGINPLQIAFPASITHELEVLFGALSRARSTLREEMERSRKYAIFHKKVAASHEHGRDSYHDFSALIKYFIAHEKAQFDLHGELSLQNRSKPKRGGKYNIFYRFYKFLLTVAQNEDEFICERARIFIDNLGGPENCRQLMLKAKLGATFKDMSYGPTTSQSFLTALTEADHKIKFYASVESAIEASGVCQAEKSRKKVKTPFIKRP